MGTAALLQPGQANLPVYAWMLLAALLCLAIHFVREGPHWQMIPAYVAVILLVAALLYVSLAANGGNSMPERVALIIVPLLIFLTALLSTAFPMFRLDAPTGPFPVGTSIRKLIDQSRMDEHHLLPSGFRELVIQAWYPAEASGRQARFRKRSETTARSSYLSVMATRWWQDAAPHAGGPYPIILFSPAWTGQRTQSSFLMQELASYGFFVVAVDHTYFSGKVELEPGLVLASDTAPALADFSTTTVEEGWRLAERCMRIEAQDLRFVLAQLKAISSTPYDPWHNLFDTEKIGTLGHSIGGAAAVQAALDDPSITAAVNMDGWMLGDAVIKGFPKPLMLIYDERGFQAPAGENIAAARYAEMLSRDLANTSEMLRRSGGYRVFLRGANHSSFTDRVLYSPLRRFNGASEADPRLLHQAICSYVTAFFAQELMGDPQPILQEGQRWTELARMERWPITRLAATTCADCDTRPQG